jgi:hypothetical protein
MASTERAYELTGDFDLAQKVAWWDTAPAYVPRHVVGRGAETNCQVVIGAVPVFNEDRHLAHLLWLSL